MKETRNQKVKFYKSIPVQIVFFNVLMLVVFNIVSYVVNDGIASMTTSFQNTLSGVSALLVKEGTVKEDMAKLDATIQSVLGLWSYYSDAEKQQMANKISTCETEIKTLVKEIGDEFAMYGDTTATAKLEASSNALIANVDEAFNIMMTSGDGLTASAIIYGDYITNMQGVEEGFKVLDASVDELQGNIATYITHQ